MWSVSIAELTEFPITVEVMPGKESEEVKLVVAHARRQKGERVKED